MIIQQNKLSFILCIFLLFIFLNNCTKVLGDWIRPQWSSDGTYISMIEQIPYSAGVDTHYGNAFYIMDVNSSDRRKLAEDIDRNYAWSPNGDKMLYNHRYDGRSEPLVVINITTEEKVVLDRSEHVSNFSWSPDAERIAFIGENDQLFIINADGKDKKKLEDLDDIWCDKVFWSPGGKKICFVTIKDDIFIIDPDGTNKKKLSTGFFLEWSPDGRQIAFFYAEYGVEKKELYLIDIVTGEKEKISDYFEGEGFSWSPDGTKIAFFANKEKSPDPDGLFIIDLNNGNKEKLIDGFSRSFSWTPDGHNIIYGQKKICVDEFPDIDAYKYGIYKINIYTKNEIILTPEDSTIGNVAYMSFSPNGMKILFQAYGRIFKKTVAEGSIYVIDSDGANFRNLN